MICGCNFKLLARGGYRCPFMLPEIASSRKLQKNFARSIEDSIKKGLYDGIFSSTASLRNSFVSRDLWGGILMEYIRNMYAKIDSFRSDPRKKLKVGELDARSRTRRVFYLKNSVRRLSSRVFSKGERSGNRLSPCPKPCAAL